MGDIPGDHSRLHVALDQPLHRTLESPEQVDRQVDPFRQIHVEEKDQDFMRSMGPMAAVAVGLALRYSGDA